MTSRSNLILVVPRSDGLLVSIEGVSYYRDMDSTQLLWMAERFLTAGLEAQREEKRAANQEERHEKG